MSGRGVDEDTCGLHLVTEVLDAIGVQVLVGVQARGVTDTAQVDHGASHFNGFFEVLGAEHTQSRGQLLVSEFFFFANLDAFTNQNLGIGRNLNTGHFGNLGGWLTDDSSVHGTVDQDDLANLVSFVLGQNITLVRGETLFHLVIDGINDDDGLFRSTDYAVVEGLGHQDRCNSTLHVSSFVDDNRNVTSANTDSRLTRRVSSLHHARTTGSQDQVDIVVLHQRIRQLNRRLVDPADDVSRSTSGNGCIQHQLSSGVGGVLGTWVRGEDDGVTSLQRNQRLEDCSRGRVGGRNDTTDDTNRLGDGYGAEFVIFTQDAAGLFIFVLVVDVLGCKVVLDNLIFDDTHA